MLSQFESNLTLFFHVSIFLPFLCGAVTSATPTLRSLPGEMYLEQRDAYSQQWYQNDKENQESLRCSLWHVNR